MPSHKIDVGLCLSDIKTIAPGDLAMKTLLMYDHQKKMREKNRTHSLVLLWILIPVMFGVVGLVTWFLQFDLVAFVKTLIDIDILTTTRDVAIILISTSIIIFMLVRFIRMRSVVLGKE